MNQKCKRWLDAKVERFQRSEGYAAEKTNAAIAREIGLKESDIVKLNYNENLFLPRSKVVELLKEVAEECDLRIYPQEEEVKLKEEIGDYLQVPVGCIAVGNSSDEVMERVIRLFLQKGERAVTFSPTFSIFKCCAEYYDVESLSIPLQSDFSIDIDRMKAAFTPPSRLLYLCSPNNPTANQLKRREVENLIDDFPGIVMVDEAYAEYADYSIVPLINKYENLVVLRTFSKAFGLAGLRLGYAVANETLAKAMDKGPAPYIVNVVSLSMGRKLLENVGIVRESIFALKAERTRLINKLNEIKGIQAFDSKTNFVLFNTVRAHSEVYQSVFQKGLVVKKLGKILGYSNCLRTTVAPSEMNAKLLTALSEYMGENA